MKHFNLKRVAFIVLLLSGLSFAAASKQNAQDNDLAKTSHKTFLAEAEQAKLKNYLVDISDWIMKLDLPSGELKHTNDTSQSIFINANLARVLVSAYRITGNRKYLDEAISWADGFCNQQDLAITSKLNQGGFWPDFPRRQNILYSNIYFGDMGTAATGLSVIYENADSKRKQIYLDALKRMALFVIEGSIKDPQNSGRQITDSFIIKAGPDKGALGCGYYEGHLSMKPYTISTATTGGAFMSQLYKLTGDQKYQAISKNAVTWLLCIQKPDGEIPYTLDGQVKSEWPLDTLTYCTEAFVASQRFFSQSEKEKFYKSVQPSIKWLLTHQNPDGTWGEFRSPDQQRSPGVVTLLNWYYCEVQQDEQVKIAIEKYLNYLLNKENSKAYGVKELVRTTGFVGLAVSEVLQPYVTF